MTLDLSLTGVSYSNSLKKKGDEWFAQCKSQVQALHEILSFLYEGVESEADKEDYPIADKPVTYQDDSKASLPKLFSQHCYSLVQLLSEETRGPVKLPLFSLMKVLSRCLRVSYSDVTALPSMTQLASELPGLHQACMDVLSQLILCCKRDLFPLSHQIIDLCLQTISSASKMVPAYKSRTRASAYQALLLWVETCSWGSYLNTHAKVIIQDLVSSTGVIEDSLRITATEKPNIASDVVFGKVKKGKKKRFNKADSYAELGKIADEQETLVLSPDELEAVRFSLSFACLAIENMPFSSCQNLVRHITDTVSGVQKKSIDKCKPYHAAEIRKELYLALSACALSTLDYSCHRNDAIFHFQLTNSALHLLIAADSTEKHEVKLVCSQALKKIELYGNCRGPVLRKVLPNDSNDAEDMTELTREKDRLLDDVESLRTRLLDSEMENEQQQRLITSLRKEMDDLRKQKLKTSASATSQNNSGPELTETFTSDKSSSDSEDETMEHDKTEKRDYSPRHDRYQLENVKQKGKDVCVKSSSDSSGKPNLSSVRPKERVEAEVEKERVDSDAIKMPSNPKKRTGTAGDERKESGGKRLKQDSSTEDDVLDEMLLDFVDAPPDL